MVNTLCEIDGGTCATSFRAPQYRLAARTHSQEQVRGSLNKFAADVEAYYTGPRSAAIRATTLAELALDSETNHRNIYRSAHSAPHGVISSEPRLEGW